MLTKFSVTNFKKFKDKLTLDFSRSRDYNFNSHLIVDGIINKAIVYGYNSSGKSNLGFAIMDIASHLTDNVKQESHYSYSLNLESGKNEATFEYDFLFEKKKLTYIYQKDLNRRLINEEIIVDGKSVFYYDYRNNSYRNDLEDIQSINIDNRIENISVLKYIRNNTLEFSKDNPIKLIVDFANEMLWFRSLRENEFMGHLANGDNISDYIVRNNLIGEFQRFLDDCDVNEKVTVITTPTGALLGTIKGKNEVPFFSICSTGTACLALFFYWKNSCFNRIKFLFLDEFDAFYHEKLSSHLLEIVFKNSGFQCIITTHNSSLATNNLTRPDSVFIIKNNKIKALSDLTNKILREGHNLRKLMEAGEFDE